MGEAARVPQDLEVLAVLCALAGTRRGDPVALVGAPERAGRALLAASGAPQVDSGARVALAGPGQEAQGRAALAAGGRLVSFAPDAAAAARAAADLGLALRHTAPVPGGVAFVAVAP